MEALGRLLEGFWERWGGLGRLLEGSARSVFARVVSEEPWRAIWEHLGSYWVLAPLRGSAVAVLAQNGLAKDFRR